MKRGPLNFLGRKNQSLFDTNIKMKDMDNVELVLGSSAIPESGTASVRARPTVKHHSSSSDSFQGFAVPTPKVPLLPPVNGAKINGSALGSHLSNGSVISVPDLVEGEIFVPPPPSTAPPPPPGTFIPPPDFLGDLNTLDPAVLQPPPMPAPKPPSLAPSMEEEDYSFLKPPPMAPPKPPSTCSSGSSSSIPISTPSPAMVPEHPSFAPPQPPTEKQNKTHKVPPPKPIRWASVSSIDSPPESPAPPPPVQTPTLSTFNPQNTAKLYNAPKTSILSGYEDRDTRRKQMLVLEDSGSVNSVLVQVDGKASKVSTPTKPVSKDVQEIKENLQNTGSVNSVLVQVDGKASKVSTPTKPVSKDVQEIKENLQNTQPPQATVSETKKETKTETVSVQPEIPKPVQSQPQKSPQLIAQVNPEPIKNKIDESTSAGRRYSPLLDRKLRNLKAGETSGAKDGHAASPLALLMAAKERDKHRSTHHSLSREDSAKKNELATASIHPNDSSPNSFVVIPRSGSSSSLTSTEERLQASVKPARSLENTHTVQTPEKSRSPELIKEQTPSTNPVLSRITAATSPTRNLTEQKQKSEQSLSKSQSVQPEVNKEELNLTLLPPPPEFDDLDDFMEPPPSILPPDPPMKKAPTPTVSPLTPAPVPSPPPNPPKPPPPVPPKLPPPDFDVKPKPQVQTKPKPAPTQLPSNLTPSQSTLLSILQKKMLEMDHKMSPVKDAEPGSDDWGSPLSEEDSKIPVVPKAKPQTKSFPVVNKAATLDMRELEKKVAQKYQDTSPIKAPTSNGPQSKHQYGMTFTVRPGTKQPITLASKGDP
ncbi:uncharacterized protein LOC110957241 isoform X2 [Acanthochromis polyacanthus]|uniref:uncharacterized protein LOC110957241 isoform X2 n=1 Tax=Acanthochromis polyacanthus TaxID=80966 RepID=UPI002234A42B|nr:uncharacterized protein LOC110957241 isoform X2 [Acanthochromis polyacanthus]